MGRFTTFTEVRAAIVGQRALLRGVRVLKEEVSRADH